MPLLYAQRKKRAELGSGSWTKPQGVICCFLFPGLERMGGSSTNSNYKSENLPERNDLIVYSVYYYYKHCIVNKITSLSQARKLGLRLVKSLALAPQFSSACPTRRLFAGAAEKREFCKEVSFPWSLICRLKTKIWQGRGLQGFVKTEATFFSHIKEESNEWQQGVAENKISQPKARPDPAIGLFLR